jgi:hypothetical protein
VTPTRLREIADQLVKNCSAYQEKIMQSGSYTPCKTCAQMAEEQRAFALKMEKVWPQLIEKANAVALATDASS